LQQNSIYIYIRATQSIIYVHGMIARFREIVLLIVQNKYKRYQTLRDLILRTKLCGTRLITQPGWLIHFRQINIIGRKYFVPVMYQLRKDVSAGLALKDFLMIHKVGQIYIYIYIYIYVYMYIHM